MKKKLLDIIAETIRPLPWCILDIFMWQTMTGTCRSSDLTGGLSPKKCYLPQTFYLFSFEL